MFLVFSYSRQAMLQLHLSYQQFNCLLMCDLYKIFYGSYSLYFIIVLLNGDRTTVWWKVCVLSGLFSKVLNPVIVYRIGLVEVVVLIKLRNSVSISLIYWLQYLWISAGFHIYLCIHSRCHIPKLASYTGRKITSFWPIFCTGFLSFYHFDKFRCR